MTSVVVCDDHGLFRSGIQRILEETSEFEVVATVSSGEQLLPVLAELQPELLVLDIRLNDANGLDLLEQVPAVSPGTRVVMLSMFGARGYIEKAKSRGARGYVTKECLDDELISVLRVVMEDDEFVSFRPAGTEDVAAGASVQANIDALSSRELEVMKLIASGLTNTEIAEELTVSPRTVESHRASIQRKLQIRTRAELARIARDEGLLD